jgi:hypothetical protein
MKQSLVLASNDLQDIERGTGTCSRIFPSLFRDPFFQMSFYKCITAMGKCQFRRGENGRDCQQKYPLSICTWHMARSALSSRRTVTHLEVQVPKKLLSRCQRSYTALSGSGEQQVASMPLCTSCSSSLGIPGPGAKEAILHCQDPESMQQVASSLGIPWKQTISHREIQQHRSILITPGPNPFSLVVVLCKKTANNPSWIRLYLRIYFLLYCKLRFEEFISMSRMKSWAV